MPLSIAHRIPTATYRVQLNSDFTFAELEQLLPHLEFLGITDCYCSPLLFSSPESSHGYDVSDYRRIDPKLGGATGFTHLATAIQERGMGLLLDFVPNHMGIGGPFNPWWRDVLENGRLSRYADFFDIQWSSHRDRLERIFLPLLEDHFGLELERGRFALRYRDGELELVYADNLVFPLHPRTYAPVLAALIAALPGGDAVTALRELIRDFREFGATDRSASSPHARVRKGLTGLKSRLAALVEYAPAVRSALDKQLVLLNGTPGDASSFDALTSLLDKQVYRLARWKAGAHGTNYRRFFAVDTLIGVRMENEEVFVESHRLLASMLREGLVQGLRIDHVDGLWDPQQYLDRLQRLAREADPSRDKPCYVLVEKILARGEDLPTDWAAHGTTGYEFIADLALLFISNANEARFTDIYQSFTGATGTLADVVLRNKRLVLEEMFAQAMENLAEQLIDLLASDRRWRDLTRHELLHAQQELIAGLEVYRTYRRFEGRMDPVDRQRISTAANLARSRNPQRDSEPIDLLEAVITGDYPPVQADAVYREKLTRWVMEFQQYTGAIQAKAVEDTAFYVFDRLIASNEVGGDPARFGGSMAEFHEANARRREVTPHSLLTTSTHDTKVSEDVRARLYTLSELPAEWEMWLQEWRELNRAHKSIIDGREAPDTREEYRLYQVLLGVWPLDPAEAASGNFRERIRNHLRKAVSEAKRNTTWIQPNEPWLEACDRFINALLDPAPENRFLPRFVPRAVRVAHHGMVNSLSQVVLKITLPGVPDFYQGSEGWNLRLVDPDNRVPVDPGKLRELSSAASTGDVPTLLRDWRTGALKLRLTRDLLGLRRKHAEFFRAASYEPLRVSGRLSDHVVAFARRHEADQLITVVPRLTAHLATPPVGPVWDDTVLEQELGTGRWLDVPAGRERALEKTTAIAEVLRELPVAVLFRRIE